MSLVWQSVSPGGTAPCPAIALSGCGKRNLSSARVNQGIDPYGHIRKSCTLATPPVASRQPPRRGGQAPPLVKGRGTAEGGGGIGFNRRAAAPLNNRTFDPSVTSGPGQPLLPLRGNSPSVRTGASSLYPKGTESLPQPLAASEGGGPLAVEGVFPNEALRPQGLMPTSARRYGLTICDCARADARRVPICVIANQ